VASLIPKAPVRHYSRADPGAVITRFALDSIFDLVGDDRGNELVQIVMEMLRVAVRQEGPSTIRIVKTASGSLTVSLRTADAVRGL